jgi:hypothetical protein
MRENIRAVRSLGVLVSAAAYVIALAVAALVVRAAGLGHPLADLALGTLVATVVLERSTTGHCRILPVDRAGRY